MKTAITELISAARGQAELLRRNSFLVGGTTGGEEMQQRLLQAKAKYWQKLADDAEQEAAGLILNLPWDEGKQP